jgi:hypothetical protein
MRQHVRQDAPYHMPGSSKENDMKGTSNNVAGLVWLAAIAVACMHPQGRADSQARVYDSAASVTLESTPGSHVVWDTAPALRYLNAQAFVDDTAAGPMGGLFAQDEQAGGGMSVTVGPISDGSLASVDLASAQLVGDGLTMAIGQIDPGSAETGVYSFADSSAGGDTYAAAQLQVSTLFRLEADDPLAPPSSADLLIDVVGDAFLTGDSEPGESFLAEVLFYIAVYDPVLPPDAPPIFSYSIDDDLVGPGQQSLHTNLDATFDPVPLMLDYGYELFVLFDAETETDLPEPATFLLVASGLALAATKLRR